MQLSTTAAQLSTIGTGHGRNINKEAKLQQEAYSLAGRKSTS